MKIWVLVLSVVLASCAFAARVTLRSAQDTFADSTNRTFNYGGSPVYYLGNRTGSSETVAWIRFDYAAAGIPQTAEVTSAICTLYCRSIENADGWRVRARVMDSAWVEGTAAGSVQPGGGTWNQQGFGLACDGSTILQQDSCWGACGAGLVPPCGGAWHSLPADSDIVNSTSDSFLVFNLTNAVQEQISSGRNFGFHFFGASPFNSRRVTIATREFADSTYHPRLTVSYFSGIRDSSFLRIAVTLPSSPLADYPVRVRFWTYPGFASENLSFFAADSVTPLYWWPDSIAGHYTSAWVMNDWAATVDDIYVRRTESPSNRNADSVFLFFDDFTEDQTLALPCTDFDNWTTTLRDTAEPFITFSPLGWDSVYRESSRITYDTQESNPALRYKWFYAGKKVHADPQRYANIFLGWASAPSLGGPWTKRGVLVDAIGDSMNLEDPDILWMEQWQKWFMVAENHNAFRSNAYYYIGLYTADSLDGTWTFRGNIADSTTLGYPHNWLRREPSSPALYLNESADTMFCYFEGFDAISYCGLLVSFGDSIGYRWHFTDTTGAVNDSNPMPIIPWGIAGQRDSIDSTPDGFYRNPDGEFWMIGHANGPHLVYKGDSPYDLVYQPLDSAQVADDFGFDPVSGYWVGASSRNAWNGNADASAAYVMRIVDFDSARWSNPKWNIHHRTSRANSYNHYVGSWTEVSDGLLILTGTPWYTSSTSLQTTQAFEQGFVVEMRMQCTNIGSDQLPHLTVSLGDDTLQDFLGSQLPNSSWYDTESQRGNSLFIHPQSSRFYRQTPGALHASLGTTFAPSAATITSMHTWKLYCTTGDSLWCFVDGERKAGVRDVTYSGMPRQLTISQGERTDYPRGGVTRVDWVRVRKFTTAEALATANDTLYLTLPGGIHPPLDPVLDLVIVPRSPGEGDITLHWGPIQYADEYNIYVSTELGNLTESVNFHGTTADTTAVLGGLLADSVVARFITVVPIVNP